MIVNSRRPAALLWQGLMVLGALAASGGGGALAAHGSFAPGDVFVSLHSGQVQWRHPDGTLNGVLTGIVPGKAEGMGFDASMNLYVTHHCADLTCLTGNSVERFAPNAASMGMFGAGYNCNPTSIVFDASGNGYVGQRDCSRDILKFDAMGVLKASYDAQTEFRGTDFVDMASDGCTLFYTSAGANVKRYNVCAGAQMTDFNDAPMSTGECHDLRILPDGGVLVAAAGYIALLDAAGDLVRTYDLAGEPDLWIGVDFVGDGTFWASNFGSSNVCHFDMATGDVLSCFNAGTPAFTVKAVAVKRAPTLVMKGRMTGGGSIFTDAGMRVTHGFELHCDAADLPNNFEVNWGPGDKFHMEMMTFAECSDDPTITPNPPAAPFDTHRGTGTGRYNGQPGATAEWILTDAGEPGRNDRWTMTIRDGAGNVVVTFANKPLTFGNHQAHK